MSFIFQVRLSSLETLLILFASNCFDRVAISIGYQIAHFGIFMRDNFVLDDYIPEIMDHGGTPFIFSYLQYLVSNGF